MKIGSSTSPQDPTKTLAKRHDEATSGLLDTAADLLRRAESAAPLTATVMCERAIEMIRCALSLSREKSLPANGGGRAYADLRMPTSVSVMREIEQHLQRLPWHPLHGDPRAAWSPEDATEILRITQSLLAMTDQRQILRPRMAERSDFTPSP